jgi:hypothetical protein
VYQETLRRPFASWQAGEMARRWLVCVLALLACNQSLFDADPGKGTDGAPADGAPPAATCPAPCAGDAVADFADTQGGANWYYLRDLGAANGADYDDLAFGSWGALPAWTASDDGPAIATCDQSSDAACAGLDGFVLLVPGPGEERPALAFRAPETATYRITGAVRVADGGPADVAVQVLVSRAGRHDAIAAQTVRTSESEVGIGGLVPAIAGDEIMLSISSEDGVPPLGVRLFFTRVDSGADAFPGSCQLALRFDSGASLEESCRGADIMDLNDGIGPAGMTTSGTGPSDRLGEARVFGEGQYMQLGSSPMNYSGDYTVQFWARLDQPQPSFNATPFADWSDVASGTHGGQGIFRDDDTAYTDFCFYTRDLGEPMCLNANTPTDAAWHFWRIVRSTAADSWQVCIDGAELVRTTVAADADMTGDEPPRLGRNIVFEPAYFGGAIDEVRIFAEALPCVTAP